MKKSISRNYFYNLIYQILIITIPIITTPYLSRILGPNGVGRYSFSFSIVSYFVLIAILGTMNYGQREIAFHRDNRQETSQIFFEVLSFRLITTIVSLVLYLLLINLLFKDDKIFLIQSIYIIAVFFDISWFFQGFEEFKIIVFRNFVLKILNVIYIFLFVKQATDLNIYIFGLAIFQAVGNISLWGYIPNYICIENIKKVNPFKHINQIIELFIPTIAVQVYLILDKIMIGMFSEGNLENGYYEQSEKIVKIGLTVVTAMGTVMVPRIAYIYENSSKNKLKKAIYKSFHFAMILTIPMCFGLEAIADKIVPWFMGNEYLKCINLIRILSPIIIAIGLSNVTGTQYLLPTKKQKIFTVTVSIGAVINIILNIIFIPSFYSMGAAVATVIAETAVLLSQMIYLSCIIKEFKIKILMMFTGKIVVSSCIMYIILSIVKVYLDSSFLSTCILIVIGILVYSIILLLFFKGRVILNRYQE